jgi:hypothetical protein
MGKCERLRFLVKRKHMKREDVYSFIKRFMPDAGASFSGLSWQPTPKDPTGHRVLGFLS